MKIALIHDWLTGKRGGERTLEAFCEVFPEADILTLIYKKGSIGGIIEEKKIFTSFLQNIPGALEKYRYYLPLMPLAVESFNLKKYDLIISLSHSVAKGVKKSKNAIHICYSFTPMRYIWDMHEEYFGKGRSNFITKAFMNLFRNYLKKWDIKSASGVDYFIASSENIKNKIKKYYKRDSTVIFPPVDISRFGLINKSDDFYLIVSALSPYKRIDLAVEAFNSLGYNLKIIGIGQSEARLKKIARPNIEFLGWLPDENVAGYYSRCKAVIFPGEEDAGIVPLEAMASGKPVIAYGRGGARETVVDGITGIFFYDKTTQSLVDSVKKFEKVRGSFNPQRIHAHAFSFDKRIFQARIKKFIEERSRKLNPLA